MEGKAVLVGSSDNKRGTLALLRARRYRSTSAVSVRNLWNLANILKRLVLLLTGRGKVCTSQDFRTLRDRSSF
jgi:hypothetical protein